MKQKYYFLPAIVIIAFCHCKTNLILVDDSARNVKSFKIDSIKLQNANELIVDFEKKLNDSTLQDRSILKGVTMTQVLQDLRTMLKYPNSTIIGNSGHYCSVAVVLNWLLNNQPDSYVNAVLNLAYYGEIRMADGVPKIKVPGMLRKKVDYTETGNAQIGLVHRDIDSTSLSDFILGVSLVYSEKGVQKIGLINPHASYKKTSWGSFVFSNSAPWEINDYFRKAGVKINEQGFYLGDSESIEQLFKIEKAVKNGKMPIIFDNHFLSYSRYKNFLYRYTGAHFITLHSFEIDTLKNIVNYTYWDYGKVKNNPWLTRTIRPIRTGNMRKDIKRNKKFKAKGLDKQKREITSDEFLKAMKGYWIPEP